MRTNPVGKPKDAHVQVYPTSNLVYTPPHWDMVCPHNIAAGAASDHSFFAFSWHLASPRWWEDFGIFPFHPTIPPQADVPDITHPTLYNTSSLQWYYGASCAPPPSFQAHAPSAPNPFPNPLMR